MKLSNVKVSVVIPNYNGLTLLKDNLPPLIEASKIKANKIFEIIVVDDASSDKSIKYVKENYVRVRVVKHKVNRGFSEAVNTGVRTAKSDLVCLLNSDVKVTKSFLESVIGHFEDDKVFGVSLHEKGYGSAKGKFEDGFVIHEPAKESNSAQETFWVSGGSGVFRRDVWHDLKGMDGMLFSPYYWEDIDLSYRAQKRGFRVLWEPKAKVVHKHESTISKYSKKNKRERIQERNQLIFIWKNITSPNLTRRHIRGLVRRIIRHPGYLRILLMALGKFPGIYSKRRVEKKESKISDEAILQRFK